MVELLDQEPLTKAEARVGREPSHDSRYEDVLAIADSLTARCMATRA